MNKHAFEIMGLDKDFNIVSLLRYFNLQWNRKFYEAGTFSVQIPLEQYDPTIKYIYTKDRPEVGEISQVNYIDDGSQRVFALSGYFLENQLNRRICYVKGTGNITNAPEWVNQSGNAEDVATAYFDAFKDVRYLRAGVNYESLLGIETSPSQGRGHFAEHERENERLGDKIHTILKPSEMSYKVRYDFIANTKVFKCIKGIDRTQNNEELNNPVILSTRYGNLKKPNIVVSNSEYKNCYIVSANYTENNVEHVDVQANCQRAEGDESDRFIYVSATAFKDDYPSQELYINALHTEALEELTQHKVTTSFDFDAVEGSYDYLVDFDLGDKCSLEVKEIQLSKDAILTGCKEVIKKGEWTLSLEFDV